MGRQRSKTKQKVEEGEKGERGGQKNRREGERQGERRKDRIKEGGTDALAPGLALSQLMSGWAQEFCVAGRG